MTWLEANAVRKAANDRGVALPPGGDLALSRAVTRACVNELGFFRNRGWTRYENRLKKYDEKKQAVDNFLDVLGWEGSNKADQNSWFCANFAVRDDFISGIVIRESITGLFAQLLENLQAEREAIEAEKPENREVGIRTPESRTALLRPFRVFDDNLATEKFAADLMKRLRQIIEKKHNSLSSGDARDGLMYLLRVVDGLNCREKQSFKAAWRSIWKSSF